jgi:hypothetical protein
MSLDADEVTVRKFLSENIIAPVMPSGGRVIPAPVYFNDKEDYWATIESVSYTTQPTIEKAHIMFCCLYFVNFVDIEGPPDSPLFGLLYELYVFSQYDSTRSDENVSPDAFNKKMLLKHNEFVACCLNLKEGFQGNRNISALSGGEYAIQRTTSLVQSERVQNKIQTEFVPGITGHLAKFQETVQLKLIAC